MRNPQKVLHFRDCAPDTLLIYAACLRKVISLLPRVHFEFSIADKSKKRRFAAFAVAHSLGGKSGKETGLK